MTEVLKMKQAEITKLENPFHLYGSYTHISAPQGLTL